ncbi:MAG: hypothetical protein RSB86_16625 [Comamonas sp.]
MSNMLEFLLTKLDQIVLDAFRGYLSEGLVPAIQEMLNAKP